MSDCLLMLNAGHQHVCLCSRKRNTRLPEGIAVHVLYYVVIYKDARHTHANTQMNFHTGCVRDPANAYRLLPAQFLDVVIQVACAADLIPLSHSVRFENAARIKRRQLSARYWRCYVEILSNVCIGRIIEYYIQGYTNRLINAVSSMRKLSVICLNVFGSDTVKLWISVYPSVDVHMGCIMNVRVYT